MHGAVVIVPKVLVAVVVKTALVVAVVVATVPLQPTHQTVPLGRHLYPLMPYWQKSQVSGPGQLHSPQARISSSGAPSNSPARCSRVSKRERERRHTHTHTELKKAKEEKTFSSVLTIHVESNFGPAF